MANSTIYTIAGASARADDTITQSAALSHSYYIPSGSRHLLIYAHDRGASRSWAGVVCASVSNGTVTIGEIYKGSNVTVTTDTNKITFTTDIADGGKLRVVNIGGETPSIY